MSTFFPLSVLTETKAPTALLAKCGWCGLYKTCQSPKMPVWGRGKKGIMVVGEAPGSHEDKYGRPFYPSAPAGKLLRSVFRSLRVDLDRDCWTTNALICRPVNNRITDKDAVEYCRPNLLKAVEEYKPKVIILLGLTAVKSVIGHLWKENVDTMSRWVSWRIPSQTFNAWVCPFNHPSYLLRVDSPLLTKLFVDDMRKAVKLESRPWTNVPNYKGQVDVEFDAKKAAKVILAMSKGNRPIAFDFETNMLKPDDRRAEIVCCSVSDGKTTIAYPWLKETSDATRAMIVSDPGKIASNMKFEERWCRALLKTPVKNWHWDTMLAAHVLDNRPMISSIKFQSFVKLGQPSYDDHIKPYLQSDQGGGYGVNRIKEVNMADLMLYCGLDSLLEWKVAQIQRKEMGYDDRA